MNDDDDDRLLRTGEVAEMFGVDPKTVARWCTGHNGKPPKIRSVRTIGGHHRIRYGDARALLGRD